jgi:hypothetical protein
MKRLAAIVLLLMLGALACTDDRIALQRGPLGPARYRVAVAASGRGTATPEHRSATLTVTPNADGASFTLQTAAREVIQAQLKRLPDGVLTLADVRATAIANPGSTELASLVGQLDPPLPPHRVRIGDRWSSTRKISTDTLSATLQTNLRIIRYRRIAGTDAAELEGNVRGKLSATSDAGTRTGEITGTTLIDWAVGAGRVASADTRLVWTLDTGERVLLDTQVRPA